MNENCDRCATRAAYFVTRAALRLFFCVECVIRHYAELMEGGWTLWPVDHVAVAPSQEVPSDRLHWPDLLS